MRRTLVIALALFTALALAAPVSADGHSNGNIQLEALGFVDFTCDDMASDLPIRITGDLEGCLYQFFGPGTWHPSNTYKEVGTEVFVGCLADGVTCGTFDTTYLFTAKYSDQNFNGQLWGRCQHPIVEGSGTGDFAGATGRLDFKDNVDAGNFSMRGHIKLDSS